MTPILEIQLHTQLDASASRQRTRQIAEICGFNKHDQTRLAATVSELARSAASAARPGHIAFLLSLEKAPSDIVIRIVNRALKAAQADLDDQTARSAFDAGVSAARRFMDEAVIDESDDAFDIRLSKALPT